MSDDLRLRRALKLLTEPREPTTVRGDDGELYSIPGSAGTAEPVDLSAAYGLEGDDALRLELALVRRWLAELQAQHAATLRRRGDLLEDASPRAMNDLIAAVQRSAAVLRETSERIAEIEARLGEGEVIEPARVIRIQGGGTVEA